MKGEIRAALLFTLCIVLVIATLLVLWLIWY